MDTTPITIAIPVYNRFDYFIYAVKSAINQTVNCDIIVVDNCSDHDKFQQYVQSLNKKNVKYYRNESNLGMVGNWNRCIELTETEWVTILHDDDTLHPQYIETVLPVLTKYKNLSALSVNYEVGEEESDNFNSAIERKGELTKIDRAYYLKNSLSPFPGVVFRKDFATKIGGFVPDEMPIPDLLFWYRLHEFGEQMIINTKLCFYRISPTQESSSSFGKVLTKTFAFRKQLLNEVYNNRLRYRLIMNWTNIELIDYYFIRYETFSDLKPFNQYLKLPAFYRNKLVKRAINKLWRKETFHRLDY